MTEATPPKHVGRPRTSSPEKKREDARLRQQRARRKQRIIKLVSQRLLTARYAERQAWLEFLAWAHDCGEDLLVGVEWDGGGSTRRFSVIAEQLLGEREEKDWGEVVSIALI